MSAYLFLQSARRAVQAVSHSRNSGAAAVRALSLSSPQGAFFGHLEPTPADPILGLTAQFKASTAENKVNLSQGAYRDENGDPYVLKCVRAAEERILNNKDLDKEYLPVEGNAQFREATRDFALGRSVEDHGLETMDQVATVQTLSGTGALRLAGEFIKNCGGDSVGKTVYVSTPTWGNHLNIFRESGLELGHYRYLNDAGTHLNLDAMVEDLKKIPAGSVVLLHACAHNPTGVDPTPEEWDVLAGVFKEHRLLPFFDMAYQGYATGDVDRDAGSLRTFVRQGLRPMFAQSYAKNLGLYGERVGALSVVCDGKEEADIVLGHLKQKCVRPMYSSPPLHGARVATEVLRDPELRAQWHDELQFMAGRVSSMRSALRSRLEESNTPNQQGNVDWHHITDQIGMFAYTGLSKETVDRLLNEHDIYMTKDGRMNIAGLFPTNIDYVAESINKVLS